MRPFIGLDCVAVTDGSRTLTYGDPTPRWMLLGVAQIVSIMRLQNGKAGITMTSGERFETSLDWEG